MGNTDTPQKDDLRPTKSVPIIKPRVASDSQEATIPAAEEPKQKVCM